VGAGMVPWNSHLPVALASHKVQVVASIDPIRQRAKRAYPLVRRVRLGPAAGGVPFR
jgi:hypothetical protein